MPLIPFGEKTQTGLSRRGYGSTLVPPRLAFHLPLPHTHSQSQREPWGNVVLMPTPSQAGPGLGSLRGRERLGGLLTYYDCEAA